MASDGHDLSTPELLRCLGRSLGAPARLLPVPVRALQAGFAIVGKPELAQRLCGSLQVDLGKTRERLGWSPPVAVEDALAATAAAFAAAPP